MSGIFQQQPELGFQEKLGYCDPSEIIVKDSFKKLLPRPTEKEFKTMKVSIEKDGQEKPVDVDQNMVMIDGFTRLEICQELGKKVFYDQRYYEGRTAILRQMAIANLFRRNLSDYQKVLLYDEIYQDEMKKAGERRTISREIRITESKGGETKELQKELKESGEGRARDKFAKVIGVSSATIHRATYIKDYGDSKTKEKLKKGKVTLSHAYYKTREKLTKKKIKEKVNQYIFTIEPKNGSIWKTRRVFRPIQVTKIKNLINRLDV